MCGLCVGLRDLPRHHTDPSPGMASGTSFPRLLPASYCRGQAGPIASSPGPGCPSWSPASLEATSHDLGPFLRAWHQPCQNPANSQL